MHLSEYLAHRSEAAAGLYIMVTDRCPLSCAHCSTDSSLAGEHYEPGPLKQLVASFQESPPRERPRYIILTGGEPLMRPALCEELARSAKQAGVRTVIATGLFFARSATVPATIMAAAKQADLLMFSLDEFHEREVSRDQVGRAIRQFLETDVDVAAQFVARELDDPYVHDLIAWLRATFDDRVPALVAMLGAVGRATTLDLPARKCEPTTASAELTEPCRFATWPVVSPDGRVVACCNQRAINTVGAGHHLHLGTTSDSTWSDLAAASRTRPALRCIRTYGPKSLVHLANGEPTSDKTHSDRSGAPKTPCQACLGDLPRILDGTADLTLGLASSPGMPVLEQEVGALVGARPPCHEAFVPLTQLGVGQ